MRLLMLIYLLLIHLNPDFIPLETGPIYPTNAFERGLVDDDEPLAKHIIQESGAYCKDTKQRHFNGTVLAYLTPWNRKGYDVVKTFSSKFDVVSPVWLQIVRLGDLRYEVRGTHDVVELKTADNPNMKSNFNYYLKNISI